MQTISKEELLHLAHLSRLELDDHEIASLIKQIDSVLQYARCVQEIAHGNTMPLELKKNSNVMREDVVIPTNPAPILEQAPECEQNYFVVPVILENN